MEEQVEYNAGNKKERVVFEVGYKNRAARRGYWRSTKKKMHRLVGRGRTNACGWGG